MSRVEIDPDVPRHQRKASSKKPWKVDVYRPAFLCWPEGWRWGRSYATERAAREAYRSEVKRMGADRLAGASIRVTAVRIVGPGVLETTSLDPGRTP